MKSKLIFPVVMVMSLAACGDEDGVGKADQKNFEVVQEGSANGVTSTIAGPGELLPPLTGTNADTTTAFTIAPNAAAAPPPLVTGTIPSPSSTAGYPSAAEPDRREPSRPQSQPRPAPERAPRPDPRDLETDPRPQPAPTDTATTPPLTTPPDQQPVPPRQDEEEEEDLPPPTTTDTRGHGSQP